MSEGPTTGESKTTSPGSDEFEELRKLDGQYEPIDSFAEWATLPIDDKRWQRQTAFLETRRSSLSHDEVEAAIEIATRAAAVDTGAIEGLYETDRGLTTTIALKEPNWETTMRSRHDRLPDLFKAHLAAYDLASKVAATKEPVTEKWVRELHEVLTEPQAEYDVLTPTGWATAQLPKGQYKEQPNHVIQKDGTKHIYAPVDLVTSEMNRLVEEIKSDAFVEGHAVHQAAYVHYALVAIHPFADGNGRVARSLASVFLRKGASIPLLIWMDQRTEYFDALEAADRRERATFVEFIFDRSLDALTFVSNELGSKPDESLRALEKLYVSYGGLTFDQLNSRANQITKHALSTFQSVVSELTPPKKVSMDVASGGAFGVQDTEYRQPTSGPTGVTMTFASAPPAQAQVKVTFQTVIAKDEDARYAFRLESTLDSVAPLELRLRDVHPEITDGVTAQMRAMGTRARNDALASLRDQASNSRRSSGL